MNSNRLTATQVSDLLMGFDQTGKYKGCQMEFGRLVEYTSSYGRKQTGRVFRVDVTTDEADRRKKDVAVWVTTGERGLEYSDCFDAKEQTFLCNLNGEWEPISLGGAS